jgi:hypothetical protein
MKKKPDQDIPPDFGDSRGWFCPSCDKIIRSGEEVRLPDGNFAHPKCADELEPEKAVPTHELRPLCAKCGEVASTFLLFNELGKWRLVFEGSAAGNGSSGDEITAERARAIIAGFTEPYLPQRVRAAGFFDDGGYCLECCQFYCSRHWHISTTGGGTCPEGHFKSLDPHWSPDPDDF